MTIRQEKGKTGRQEDDMTIDELIERTRTVRRFRQDRSPDRKTLRELVRLACLGGSARNAQPLRYVIVTRERLCNRIFPLLGWAGYLSDWPGPAPGERPQAYIICLLDEERLAGPLTEACCDLGIATQNLLLAAASRGIFGCRIGAFSGEIHRLLGLPERLRVLLVVALGYPAERVVLEEVGPSGDVRYWRDAQQVHHVPKRRLDDVLVEAPQEPGPESRSDGTAHRADNGSSPSERRDR